MDGGNWLPRFLRLRGWALEGAAEVGTENLVGPVEETE